MPKSPNFAGWRMVGFKEVFRKGDVVVYHGLIGHPCSKPESGEPVSLDYVGKDTPQGWNWLGESSYWTVYRKSDMKFVNNLPEKPLFKIKLPLP